MLYKPTYIQDNKTFLSTVLVTFTLLTVKIITIVIITFLVNYIWFEKN